VISATMLATVDGLGVARCVIVWVAQVRVELVDNGRTHVNEVLLIDGVLPVLHVEQL